MIVWLGPHECQVHGGGSYGQAWHGWWAPEVLGTQQPTQGLTSEKQSPLLVAAEEPGHSPTFRGCCWAPQLLSAAVAQVGFKTSTNGLEKRQKWQCEMAI
jgi:hypothetical protein